MNRQITTPELGALVLVKGEGFAFHSISFLLSLVNPSWRRRDWKPWHTLFISGQNRYGSWQVCEALAPGIVVNPLSNYDGEDYRMYRWFDSQLDQAKVNLYVSTHLGRAYDVAQYFFTAIQYLVRHFWNRPIPRLLDNRYSCWENLFEFCSDMGKPIEQIGREYDCPLITEVVTALEES